MKFYNREKELASLEKIRRVSFSGSLIVMETERLLVREMILEDVDALFAIMGKLEVMYAWEHGFAKEEVREWIGRQIRRYREEGCGYYAVILKENGSLIGQAGLLRSIMNGMNVVEVGYIFDNVYWHNGYGTEAANACLEYAFGHLGLNAVYCSIRLENKASIRVAERLGMTLHGSHVVTYRGKEMPHLIYEKRG